ncbi:hypothetical protein FHS83_001033 [Rhizomicrobium palustre]|uniref:DUF3551 domain-containing protein n=1 Tax=Rhizomicrobium palustre TaxID=189966 RepID=A0A846MWV8_9PROT|nr:hypothetical protein [Rhizomicrobium palustre]NIK87715.1 hypothetical protein [Rhizomicrobium palustre]
MKTAAIGGLLGLFTMGPAAAERGYTRCDVGGGRCVRVTCDYDGDDCRARHIPVGWQGYRNDYDPYAYGRYHGYGRYDREEWRRHHGRWNCDGASEYCRWERR